MRFECLLVPGRRNLLQRKLRESVDHHSSLRRLQHTLFDQPHHRLLLWRHLQRFVQAQLLRLRRQQTDQRVRIKSADR